LKTRENTLISPYFLTANARFFFFEADKGSAYAALEPDEILLPHSIAPCVRI
jgi:hypothetical protein